MTPLAVFGDPIAHSLSPRLHALFAAQVGLTVDYRAILTPVETFAQQLQAFFSAGGVGANVTLPHKQRALESADFASPRAQLAGAANTLRADTSAEKLAIHADNTDGEGLVNDLIRQIGTLQGSQVLILGAGGAVRGALGPLLDAGCAGIAIYNRTFANADLMVRHVQQSRFAPKGAQQRLRALDASAPVAQFDIVINAISAGHQGQFPLTLPAGWLQQVALAYDMSYGAAAQPFANYVKQRLPRGVFVSGLGMLVEQGAASFKIWTGQGVDTNQALTDLQRWLEKERWTTG